MKLRILYPILLFLFLISCHRSYVKQKADFTHYSLKTTNDNAAVNAIVSPYTSQLKTETERVIAVASAPLTRDNEQSTLGNFVCDALKAAAAVEFKNVNPDLVIVNRGGLRINLPKGDIKVLNIFELMPFDNELVLVTITGDKLEQGIKTIIEKKHSYLGLQLKLKNDSLLSATINNLPIDKNKTYTIVTSDYLANGGDSFLFLKDPVSLQRCNLKIRDAIINYCMEETKNGKQLIPYTDERLQLSK